ncbi:S8 family peptidase [Cognatishimia activa]|uniref:S8 family peptidase n=1 Tax=Cognatishimia activa TaxID=1715691 RepID=UPI002231F84C|nr:S8 family peptidase [Cognatishimia activa]UZD89820.1 S8 family serine peptidase [Cognatishimia activa]
MNRSIRNLAVVVLGSTLLAGCSGEDDLSGSSSGSTLLPFTTSATLLASFLDNLDGVRTAANNLINNDVRYRQQNYYYDLNSNNRYDPGTDLAGNPLQAAGVHYAHAAGLTGAGETIAITDNGFLTTHEAFAGRATTVGTGLAVEDHGTFVASIAAGSSSTMTGVAPGANLILGEWGLSNLAATVNAATTAGAVAYNNSWGFVGMNADTTSYNTIFGNTVGANYLNALKTYAQDGIVLFSIDNDTSITSVGLMPGLPILEPDLEESWIAVVNGIATLSGDDIVSATRISGACLEAAEWCLAADGTWTGADSTSNTSYSIGTGTSYAAPTIAGALALMAEAFPTMTHQELRIRLLASADNDFAGFTSAGTVELVPGFEHEYSSEWGHGFLDVAAALLPIGQSTIVTSSGAEINPETPLVVTGGASGDAVSRALKGVNVISQDTLAAQFAIEASSMVVDASRQSLFSLNDVSNFGAVQNASYGSAAFFGDGQHIPMQWGDSDISFAFYQRPETGADSFGFGASRSFDLDGATLEVNTAFGGDTGGLLSDWNGGTQSKIFSAGMALSADVSPLSELMFEVGYATGRETSVIGQSSDVLMNTAALSLTRRNTFARDDSFKVSLALPAAVTRGQTSLNLPVRSDDGKVAFQSIPIDLAPDKRELRLELTYERPLSRGASLGFSVAHAQNRGNIAGERETGLVVSYTKRF